MADGFRIGYEKSLRRITAKFGNLPEEAERELEETVRSATDLLYDQAQENIRNLFNTSGKMSNALQRRVRHLGPGRVVGSVYIEGTGYITQERGGLKPYDIFPRARNALRFFVAGSAVFAMVVHRLPLPRRSYLALALNQKRAEIRAMFDAFAKRAWDKSE